MPTPGAGIKAVGIVYETIATDKIGAPSSGVNVLLKAFSIQFELNAADRRYLETSTIKAFGVEFEYAPLYCEEVVEKRI